MVLKVVPLAKLLPHAHFPVNEDPSRIPGRPSGLFAGKVLWTISLPLSTPGTACCKSPLDYLLIASDLPTT